MKVETGKQAPLSAWAVTVVVFLTVTVISLFWKESVQDYFVSITLDRLTEFEMEEKAFKVVFLGTSRTDAGIFFDDLLERAIEEKKNVTTARIEFLRIVRLAGRMPHFFPLLDPILESGPNLILIEASLPLIDDGKSTLEVHQTEIQNVILNYRKLRAAKEKTRVANTLESQLRGIERPVRQDSVFLAQYREKRSRWKLTDIEPPKPLADFYETAVERGIEVMLVEVPRSEQAERVLPTADSVAVELRLKLLRDRYEIGYLPCPISFKLHHYTDFTHLRPEARNAYCDWLVSRLRDLQNIQVATK